MILESITLEGFLSYRKSQTVDLTGLHVCLVNGAIEGDINKSNGAGKSSLLESVGVCFFGKTGGRSDILDRYINDKSDKFKIEVIFSIDGKQWKVVRIKPKDKTGSFQISFKTEKGWKITDSKIEDILGLSFPTYGSTIYLSERESLKFITGTSTDRKEILRELLNIEVFEEASKSSSKSASEIDKKCNINMTLIESKNNQIQSEGEIGDADVIETTVLKAKQIVIKKKKDLNDANEKLKTLEINASKKISIEKSLSDENDRLDKAESDLDTYKRESNKIASDGKQCSAQIKKYKTDIEATEKQISVLQESLKGTEPKNENITEKLETARKKTKELNGKVSKLREDAAKIEAEKGQIEKLIQKIKKFGSACPVIDEACSVITDEFRKDYETNKSKEFTDITTKLEELATAIIKAEKAVEKSEETENELLQAMTDAETLAKKRKKLQDELKVKENSIAPIKQDLAKLEGSIEERRIAYEKAENDVEKTEGILEEIKEKIVGYEKELAKFETDNSEYIKIDIQKITKEIELRESQIVELTKELTIIEEKKTRVDILKKDIEIMMGNLNELKDEKNVYSSLIKIFGKDGIQKAVMKDAVPALEETANELLKIFTESDKLKVKFELDPRKTDGDLKAGGGLDILVIEAGKEPKDLSMYSGGETVRIVFSIVLSLAKLLSKRSGKRQETLIIDEKIAKLDVSGIEQFAEIIKIIAKWYKKVFIVTHIGSLKDLLDGNGEIFVNKVANESLVKVTT